LTKAKIKDKNHCALTRAEDNDFGYERPQTFITVSI